MKITIINPNVVTQKGDFFGTGIPYMPIIPAYLASYLQDKKYKVHVIDAFGENPFKKRKKNGFIIQGLTPEETSHRIPRDSNLICIYAGHVVEHNTILEILKSIKDFKIPIAIIENSQAVTAYSLKLAHQEFLNKGADFVVLGEPEKKIEAILNNLKGRRFSTIKGLIYKSRNKIRINDKEKVIDNLDALPFPAWELFPLENYWKLKYSHAPYQGKYLPLLTSRGCPFKCEFCIIPFTNKRKWRSRSPKNIIDEITHWIHKYNIRDFHIEDLNPTINKKRIEELSKLIIKNNLNIKLKFASGIKLETIDEDTIKLLAKAGCNYISFSPESGSRKVLDLMNKPFNHLLGINSSRLMNKLGIKTQACFVLGFPGEDDKDRRLTKKYIKKLTKIGGLDEIALFIMTPIPGSKIYESTQKKPEELSKLTFSPKWRKEYRSLNKFRKYTYISFIIYKTLYQPTKVFKQVLKFISGKFDTKMEMTLYRLLKTYF